MLASVLFLMFGLWMLLDGALGWRWVAIAVTAAVALARSDFGGATRCAGAETNVPIAWRSPDTL